MGKLQIVRSLEHQNCPVRKSVKVGRYTGSGVHAMSTDLQGNLFEASSLTVSCRSMPNNITPPETLAEKRSHSSGTIVWGKTIADSEGKANEIFMRKDEVKKGGEGCNIKHVKIKAERNSEIDTQRYIETAKIYPKANFAKIVKINSLSKEVPTVFGKRKQ